MCKCSDGLNKMVKYCQEECIDSKQVFQKGS